MDDRIFTGRSIGAYIAAHDIVMETESSTHLIVLMNSFLVGTSIKEFEGRLMQLERGLEIVLMAQDMLKEKVSK